jgi:hypothetical protein
MSWLPAPRTKTDHRWECSVADPTLLFPIWNAMVPYVMGTHGALAARAMSASAMAGHKSRSSE